MRNVTADTSVTGIQSIGTNVDTDSLVAGIETNGCIVTGVNYPNAPFVGSSPIPLNGGNTIVLKGGSVGAYDMPDNNSRLVSGQVFTIYNMDNSSSKILQTTKTFNNDTNTFIVNVNPSGIGASCYKCVYVNDGLVDTWYITQI